MKEEEALAVREIAKTTGQAIGTVERVGAFFARIMGEPLDAVLVMLKKVVKPRVKGADVDKRRHTNVARFAGMVADPTGHGFNLGRNRYGVCSSRLSLAGIAEPTTVPCDHEAEYPSGGQTGQPAGGHFRN